MLKIFYLILSFVFSFIYVAHQLRRLPHRLTSACWQFVVITGIRGEVDYMEL